MAVLKQTSPTACPTAPKPKPSSTVPSASTSKAVALGSVQAEPSCLSVMSGLHSADSAAVKEAKGGLAHGLWIVLGDGDAGLLCAGGSQSGVYPGLRGGLHFGFDL